MKKNISTGSNACSICRFSKILIAAMIINFTSVSNSAFAENTTTSKALTFLKEVNLVDGKFIDENGNEVNNVITKYEKQDVIKYYDLSADRLVTEEERLEGVTYNRVKTTVLVPKYYITAVTKNEYGTGNSQVNFTWNTDNNGNLKLNTIEDDTLTTDLTFKYSNENTSERLENPTGDINKNFIGNSLTSGTTSVYGAAIYNKDNNIGTITGDFVNNSMPSVQSTYGTAIYNENGTIESIKGNFVNNTMDKPNRTSYGYGGAIYNTKAGNIKNIEGNFIGNKIISGNTTTNGGAIYNGSHNSSTASFIGNITGDFIGNGVQNTGARSNAHGGAIYNNKGSQIGDINGNFIGNFAIHDSKSSYAGFPRGGAIYTDQGSIGNINGDFIGNYLRTNAGGTQGGAICNYGTTFKNITGDFIGNYIEVTTTEQSSAYQANYGGAIYNSSGRIGDIKGNFIGNHIKTPGYAQGGAIMNYSSNAYINSIEGNFYNNYAESTDNLTYGGAIDNTEEIGSISGIFANNYAKAQTTSYGGAISNRYAGYVGPLTLKNSSFFNNHADSATGVALGGAIYSQNNLNIIADNGEKNIFQGNYTNTNGVIDYNAIYMNKYNDWNNNKDYVPNITLTANNNSNITFWDNINGVDGYKVNINGDGTGSVSLYNDIKNADISVDNVTIDMANNIIRDYEIKSLTSTENAKYNFDISFENGNADRLVILNPAAASGNVIKLNILNFIDEYKGTPITVQIIKSANDNIQLTLSDNIILKANLADVIYNDNIVQEPNAISLATKDTTNDSISINGKVYDTLDAITSYENENERSFVFRTEDKYIVSKNLETAASGTLNIKGLENGSSIIDGNNHSLFNIDKETTLNIDNVQIEKASSVINNTNKNAVINISNSKILNNTEGITTAGNLNIKGNSTVSNNGSGITITTDTAAITLDAADGNIIIDDKINGALSSKLAMKNGNITLNKQVTGSDIEIDKATVNVASDNLLNNLNVNVLSDSTFNYANNSINHISFNSLKLNGNMNLAVDVDLANKSMDTISAASVDAGTNNINVNKMNLLSDAKDNKTSINFADETLKNHVTTSVKEVAYAPIYKYEVNYDKTKGDFNFTRGGSDNTGDNNGDNGGNGGNTGNGGNGGNGGGNIDTPIILPPSYESFNPSIFAAPVAAQLGGYLTQLNSYDEAFRNMDMYMLMTKSQRQNLKNLNKYASSDSNVTFTPLSTPYTNKAGWFRPYTTFESVGLKNGPKVSNVAYGSFFGADTELYDLGHGWDGMVGFYAGYNGSHQAYNGISIYQNGGTLGVTGMAYKGNFFTGLTVNAGANGGEASTAYGNDNFAMLMTGIANKTGYNVELADGKFIIQPNFLLSYSFVNTFDYTSAAGVRINSDPLHAIQVEPGIKFIGNFKNGLQPYAGVSMVWNIMDRTDFNANDVALPELSIKPFVKYGIGVRKLWGERTTGYFQTFLTNGGRNGVGLQAGCRIKIGQ